MDRIDGIPKLQSAYRRGHNTETALLKVMNNFLRAADLGKVSALCLLDLSPAFDHQLLLSRLQCRFGVVGTALDWFRSCLHDRTYSVLYALVMSDVVLLTCSVPQRSVLGVLLFVLYTAELVDMRTLASVYICTLMTPISCMYIAAREKLAAMIGAMSGDRSTG